jgi:hypothetical protein
MFICKASTRVLYVYALDACSLKSKFMWHSSIDYWVCYCMFHSKGMKKFPTVAWSRLKRLGILLTGVRAQEVSLEWRTPACGWPGERYNSPIQAEQCSISFCVVHYHYYFEVRFSVHFIQIYCHSFNPPYW